MFARLNSFLKRIYARRFSLGFPEGFSFDAVPFNALRLARHMRVLFNVSVKKAEIQSNDTPLLFMWFGAMRMPVRAFASGKSLFSDQEAFLRAVMEIAERYAWYNYAPEIALWSASDDLGKEALDLSRLAGFSDAILRQARFCYDATTRFGWLPVNEVGVRKKVYVPAQLISPHYFSRHVMKAQEEPILRPLVTTGIAAGFSRDEALVRGTLEALERDAFMITYLNKLSPRRISLDEMPVPLGSGSFKNYLQKYGLKAHALYLITDAPVHCVAALIIDDSGHGPAVSIGAKASFSLAKSVTGALEEAMAIRATNRKMGYHLRTIAPHGARLDQEGRKIWWSMPGHRHYIDFLIAADEESPRSFVLPKTEETSVVSPEAALLLQKWITAKGYGYYYCDITPRAFRRYGAHIIETLIPELQPLHLRESMPFMGGKRLREVPAAFGFSLPRNLNEIPHPFH